MAARCLNVISVLMVFCPGERLKDRPEIQKVVHADDNTSNQDRIGFPHNTHSPRIVQNEVLTVNGIEIRLRDPLISEHKERWFANERTFPAVRCRGEFWLQILWEGNKFPGPETAFHPKWLSQPDRMAAAISDFPLLHLHQPPSNNSAFHQT